MPRVAGGGVVGVRERGFGVIQNLTLLSDRGVVTHPSVVMMTRKDGVCRDDLLIFCRGERTRLCEQLALELELEF